MLTIGHVTKIYMFPLILLSKWTSHPPLPSPPPSYLPVSFPIPFPVSRQLSNETQDF